MASTAEVCGAASAVASFDAGFTAVQPPLSSRAVVGIEDDEAMLSRLASPCELAAFSPSGSTGWERLVDVLEKVWDEFTVDDLLQGLRHNLTVMKTVTESPVAVFESFVTNLFEYFKEEVSSILELLWALLTTLAEASQCKALFFRATADEFVALVFDGEFEPLVILGTMQEQCELFRKAVTSVGMIQEKWAELVELGFDGLVDHMGEFAAAIVEMLRDADLQKRAMEMASDPVKLGAFYGTLYGFILWEVLETLLSGPFGKAGKALKVTLK